MAKVKGVDVVLSVYITNAFIDVGGQKNATLNRSSETIEVTNKSSANQWKENLAGFKEWGLDCDGLYVVSDAGYAALQTAFNAGTQVQVKMADESNISYTGYGYITDFPIEAPYDDAATYSVSILGTGALA